jgi:hypothetical protein
MPATITVTASVRRFPRSSDEENRDAVSVPGSHDFVGVEPIHKKPKKIAPAPSGKAR